MTTFRKMDETSSEDVAGLSALATAIVREHYDPILGQEQNSYMLDLFQSPHGILEQVREGYRYYWVMVDDTPAGFMAFYPRDGKMYLSKFYLDRRFRGRGAARDMLNFVAGQAREEGLPAVFLNVNKYNDHSIAVYHHLGFRDIGKEKNPIGNGYYMDDFVLEYQIPEV